MRKRNPLGPFRRPMPRVLGGSQGGWRFLMVEVALNISSRRAFWLVAVESDGVKGYLAHKKSPIPLGPPWLPRHRPTVLGSP